MTQRSMQVGQASTVIIHAGADVQVEGWDDDRVLAEAEKSWGLKIGQRNESSIGRVRAKVGDRVLLDVELGLPGRKKQTEPAQAIQVEIGASGKVHVPRAMNVQVYAGNSIEAREIRGSVTAYAGLDVRLRNIQTLVHASAGREMDVDCETLAGDDVKFSSGRDLRFYIHDLYDARIVVNDLGGYWVGAIGEGRRKIRLDAGGDVTLVTQHTVKGQPPDYVLGNIEIPSEQAK